MSSPVFTSTGTLHESVCSGCSQDNARSVFLIPVSVLSSCLFFSLVRFAVLIMPGHEERRCMFARGVKSGISQTARSLCVQYCSLSIESILYSVLSSLCLSSLRLSSAFSCSVSARGAQVRRTSTAQHLLLCSANAACEVRR